MPHTTVTYTRELDGADAIDWAAFAPELQAVIVSVADARPEACRTRYCAADDDWYIAGGTQEVHQAVHIEIALKAGRAAEVKGELSRQVLALLRKHLAPTPAYELHLSVEVRDIDPAGYVSHVEPRQDG
jgi:5-carboxymethyl-2-hydroxymuconate isomerase